MYAGGGSAAANNLMTMMGFVGKPKGRGVMSKPSDDVNQVNRAANNTETSGLVTYEEVTVLCMKFATSSRFDIVD
ncbi:uncharacterized protein LOC135217483 isoform X2 [Macrobrachium nipponense]|uniref:uncharacterized protein LOC135217483 isoform X2 n=1 Tax=Macrobrachium nipponense TaxID=159736 RepID=UPI0030C7CDF3